MTKSCSTLGGAVFRGSLSTTRPPKVLYSGYCAIRSHVRKVGSTVFNTTLCHLLLQPMWYDNGCFDLSPYDALRLRVRGDGRKFVVNIQCQSLVKPTDVWQFFMFTRGGPYWEDITVNHCLIVSCYNCFIFRFRLTILL